MFLKTCKHYIITLFSSSECNDSNGIIILKFNFSVYILFRFKSIPWLYLECPFFESNIWRKKNIIRVIWINIAESIYLKIDILVISMALYSS